MRPETNPWTWRALSVTRGKPRRGGDEDAPRPGRPPPPDDRRAEGCSRGDLLMPLFLSPEEILLRPGTWVLPRGIVRHWPGFSRSLPPAWFRPCQELCRSLPGRQEAACASLHFPPPAWTVPWGGSLSVEWKRFGSRALCRCFQGLETNPGGLPGMHKASCAAYLGTAESLIPAATPLVLLYPETGLEA